MEKKTKTSKVNDDKPGMTMAEAFMTLIGRAYVRGSLETARWLDPVSDRVREKDIPAWLNAKGIDRKVFNRLRKAGRIRPFKIGEAQNTPNFYSVAEIVSAMQDYDQESLALNTAAAFRMREGLKKQQQLKHQEL